MATLNLQVGASLDDSEMQSSGNNSGRNVTVNGATAPTSGNLPPGSHGLNNEYSVGVRFTSVTIDNSATINSATLTLNPSFTYSASPNVVSYHVSAQAADNAGAFTSDAGDLNITARPRSTADAGPWVQTSVTANTIETLDVANIVQETVNRAGWSSGNAIVILIDTHADTTQGEWQDYDSYDGDSANAAQLDIDYTVGGGDTFLSPTRTLLSVGI